MDNGAQKAVKSSNLKASRIKNTIRVTFVILFTLLVYKKIYMADFFLDDYLHLHLVQKIGNPITPYITNLFMGAFYRPGVFIFWKINHLLFGLNAAGYYATNIVFLISCVALLYFVILNMTGHRKFSTLATALFAFSPVTAVGVVWLSNRFDLIGTTFYLLALLLFLKYLRSEKQKFYYWAILSGVFSYFCKEMMITLPVVMVICGAFMYSYRKSLTWHGLKRILVLATPFFTLGVLFILVRYGVIHSLGGYSGETKVSLDSEYFKILFGSFSNYFWLMASKTVFFIYCLLFVLLLAKNDFIKNNPLSMLGIILATVTAIPLVLIIKLAAVMTYMTPRFFFLPAIGMTILLASVYDPRSQKWRKALATMFISVTLVLFMMNTFLFINKWVDDRNESVRSMNKIAGFVKQSLDTVPQGQIYFVEYNDSDNDVALDAGIKIRHPELVNRCYFIKPLGPTQVIGTEALHLMSGRELNWPNTFDKNPCNYEDLWYGVVDTTFIEVMDKMNSSPNASVIIKDKMGRLLLADLEKIQSILAARGVGK